jgi:hypothetical protein
MERRVVRGRVQKIYSAIPFFLRALFPADIGIDVWARMAPKAIVIADENR